MTTPYANSVPSQSVSRFAPLEGVRVLDLTRYIAGPFCGQMLADAGAEVIKVEPPGGEISRHEHPRVRVTDEHETSLLFLRFNRGKKSIEIDMRSEEGRRELRALVRSADVLIENFRPGVLDSWGLDWPAMQSMNPKLIYMSISGFGHLRSPLAEFPAFNTIAEAMGGLVSRWPGEQLPPLGLGIAAADGISGMFGTIGVLQALLQRERTGEGQRMDIAMYDVVLAFNDLLVARTSLADPDDEDGKKIHAPFGYFPTGDGWLAIGVGTDRAWRALCELAKWDDWLESGRFDSRVARVRHSEDEIAPRLADWLRTMSKWDAARLLAAHGVPAGPLQSGEEIVAGDQARTRGIIRTYDAVDGPMNLVASPFGVHIGDRGASDDFAPPGMHSDELRLELAAGQEDSGG